MGEADCKYCGAAISFIRVRDGMYWCAHLGTSNCEASASGGRHYPVNPVECYT